MSYFYSKSVSPIKGNDVPQQQAPLVVGEFAVEEEVLSVQEVWKDLEKEDGSSADLHDMQEE